MSKSERLYNLCKSLGLFYDQRRISQDGITLFRGNTIKECFIFAAAYQSIIKNNKKEK
jgi:hypothetical protein